MSQPVAPKSKSTSKPRKAAHTTKSKQPVPPDTPQESANPLTIALQGLENIFQYARPVAVVFCVMIAVGVVTGAIGTAQNKASAPATLPPDTTPATQASLEQVILAVLIIISVLIVTLLLFVAISAVISGLAAVASAATANQEKITLRQAFAQLMKRFPGYYGLQLLIGIKLFAWLLLLVVPGIIMAVRYSLANTAYFARNLSARQAIHHSTAITKNHWITTLASFWLPNIITLGIFSPLINMGVQSQLLRQLDSRHKTHAPVLGTHWLSMALFVIVAFFLGIIFVAFTGAVVGGIVGIVENVLESLL